MRESEKAGGEEKSKGRYAANESNDHDARASRRVVGKRLTPWWRPAPPDAAHAPYLKELNHPSALCHPKTTVTSSFLTWRLWSSSLFYHFPTILVFRSVPRTFYSRPCLNLLVSFAPCFNPIVSVLFKNDSSSRWYRQHSCDGHSFPVWYIWNIRSFAPISSHIQNFLAFGIKSKSMWKFKPIDTDNSRTWYELEKYRVQDCFNRYKW